MESHVLNYHHARLRPIGYKTLRVKTNSLSSESSCNQNSPEYPQISVSGKQHSGSTSDWYIRNQAIASQSCQDTSSENDSTDEEDDMEESEVNKVHSFDTEDNTDDSEVNKVHSFDVDDNIEERENIEVCDVYVEDEVDEEIETHHNDIMDNMYLNRSNSIDDHSLVEGHDYEVIAVYTVNPNLALLEPSSEDDGEEYVNEKDSSINDDNCTSYICQDGEDINLEPPMISNVDEYFVKNDNSEQHILNVEEPVVRNVDEYFLDLGNNVTVPNVDDFFIKHKLPEEQFELPNSSNKVEHFFVTDSDKPQENDKVVPEPLRLETETNVADISINESDLAALPNIEDLKRYLIEDLPYTKIRHIQKSCSVPQSPMQNICMDVDDAKTCLSFEDLNLDLSDLAFENEKSGKASCSNKTDDVPRTLTDEDINSFICKYNNTDHAIVKQDEDDLSPQDMEIEATISSGPPMIDPPSSRMTSTPIPTVLNFCIEKTSKEDATPVKESKIEFDDFVDVESCSDAAIPVLEANNLSSLLEQFEATEKLNTKKRPEPVEDSKIKSYNKNTLTNGMRLKDAGMQLTKNRMRQILMPTPINSTISRSESPVHSDHDYCSPKKRHSLPNLKKGQSLLKPEVLSSNNKILNSRHRSCKSKKVVYHLSSDEETEGKNSKNKKVSKCNDIDFKNKNSAKPSVKPPVQSNCRKKLSPTHSDSVKSKNKTNNSVMLKSAFKASDNCSQNSNSSIKLTIKNKSEVILNCDYIDSQKDKTIEVNCKNSNNLNTNNLEKKDKNINELGKNECRVVNTSSAVEDEPHSKSENFYTGLFNNKKELQIPKPLEPKIEKSPVDHELNKCMEVSIKKEEQPLKKKKLNLQEYKLRRGVSSNTSSAQVSPEAIFPDMPSPGLDKAVKCPIIRTTPNGLLNTAEKVNNEEKFFDPIKEASRKILMNSKKQKAEAIRKRDEDIVMSKIPKVENFQLQPLISDAEMLKIVGMTKPEEMKLPIVKEKPRVPANYEEIILVSIGINTNKDMFQKPVTVYGKPNTISPLADSKSIINFKIKKSDHVLKQNVFDIMKRENRIPIEEKKHDDLKINKERYRDITAALKSVKKQVDTKISSNSLFASIQDVVMKKAPDNITETHDDRHLKSKSNLIDKCDLKCAKTKIVREYDSQAEHGEDKVILHLRKHRSKPKTSNVLVQTDQIPEFTTLAAHSLIQELPLTRKRNDSDMSLSSDGSTSRRKEMEPLLVIRSREKIIQPKEVRPDRIEREAKEKRSLSKDRYESKYRCRSRSTSRSCRRRSRSRSQSRSHGRYRRYRRSDSPYKRKRRSRSRSFHKRRSPSVRRDRPKISKSGSRTPPRPARPEARSKTPVKKFKPNSFSNSAEKKPKSLTPPLRKPTVSESSVSSSSSSSSCSSSSSSSSPSSRSSSGSSKSRRSCSSFKRDDSYKNNYRGYSSEDRESNTPVEERRIVFVGRLEKNITKAHLRNLFSKFGAVMEVRLHSKEDGSRYGFVTYQRARDAWSAVEAANTFPQYDVGFGGRRAFCRQSYADLDGLEAKYTESAYHGAVAAPVVRRNDDMPFDQMLLEMKRKLNELKNDKKRED
ncbi:unnamed protein product [Arctia plantaginis]|uniref:RRM domain-containing protein n=1 Tax=Arctia plantaginis TaxID=874455 RepID=A0A8S1BJE0_ARCPL|nr:unnamed protein product [Arctia plantaginis]